MILRETDIDLKLHSRGKVRDIYDLDDRLLIVTTDRMSAFDRILPDPIPYKGMVLNNLSLFWFDMMKDIMGNHCDISEWGDYPASLRQYEKQLKGRSVIALKAEPLKVECIVRGFITGSGWSSYKRNGTVCGIALPGGLKECQELSEPLFTPSTKADEGHDENISYGEMADIVGAETAAAVRETALAVYIRARDYARQKGIIIADTKMEFGILGGKIIIIDELLTPDSSRFWPVQDYEAGRGQKSFDKQYLRDWLSGSGWDKDSEPPRIPDEVISTTAEKYLEAYRMITGRNLDKD